MSKYFKTKDEAIKFIKKLSFNDIRYNRIEMGKNGKVWWIRYEERV
jgi:hypothetical protein